MQFQLPIQIRPAETRINYRDKILLTGSCFTEHIGNSLGELKFSVLQNPNGILFDPRSVCSSLISYIANKRYGKEDLFFLNELWNSWEHHSRFSNMNADECLKNINESQEQAHNFLKEANWLIITLGSSFSYRLTSEFTKISPNRGDLEGAGVANCHRAPSQWFNKYLLTTDEIISKLDVTYRRLIEFNPKLKIIFTISPVRHIRDGVVENNRSKARLIEVVHHAINTYPGLYYFPAYELVIDVLRDYRFYDVDMVHPNYSATEFVMEKFRENFVDEESQQLMEEVKKIITARKHKAFQPETNAHKHFLKAHLEKANDLQTKYPFLHLTEEIDYFSDSINL
ncbi:MAG TPA: GSCFA domain-containing protein [Chitinophagaceae bacterium]|nr:GSCFA domain-containing protein [Chitinophagaceae bacterium]